MSEVKHDYLAALNDIRPMISRYGADVFSQRTGNRVYTIDGGSFEAIIHALKLAAVVTGEPTEGMLDEGVDAWKTTINPYKAGVLHKSFKAMIAQAEKEIG